jgi:TPR repeat protein
MTLSEREQSRPEWSAIEIFETGNYKRAFPLFLALSENGSPLADFYLAWMLKEGKGAPQDLEGAKQYFERAAQAGIVEGIYYLGSISENQGNLVEAFKHYQSAAPAGFLPAIYSVGRLLVDGSGVQRNILEGRTFLERAMLRGHVPAMRKLAGVMLEGKLGILLIPKGLLLFVLSIIRAITLSIRDIRDDRLRA